MLFYAVHALTDTTANTQQALSILILLSIIGSINFDNAQSPLQYNFIAIYHFLSKSLVKTLRIDISTGSDSSNCLWNDTV